MTERDFFIPTQLKCFCEVIVVLLFVMKTADQSLANKFLTREAMQKCQSFLKLPAVHSLASSSYPSEQSGAPSHRYWMEMQLPSDGHLKGSYGWQASAMIKRRTRKVKLPELVSYSCGWQEKIKLSRRLTWIIDGWRQFSAFDCFEDFDVNLTLWVYERWISENVHHNFLFAIILSGGNSIVEST